MSTQYIRYPNAGASTGTVTSVALSDASSTPIYTISGSPVTTSGTLTFTLATETANKIFAGPTSGGAAQPTFRSLVSADLPAGTGTVTSVALTAPGILSVAGSPVTTTGTLALSLATQSANLVFAGPSSGGAVAPTFRSLVSADIGFPLFAPNGAAGTPEYSFSNFTTTGWYATAGPTLNAAIGGTQYFQLTTTLSYFLAKIHLIGDATASAVQYGNNTTNTGQTQICGSTSAANGAVINLYGSAHASLPDVIKFSNSTIDSGNINASGLWTIGPTGSIQNNVMNGRSLALTGSHATSTYYSLVNSGAGDAILDVAVQGAGDPFIYFNGAGVGNQWSAGLDNSDSDKFKISLGTALGTTDALVITTAQAVSIHGTATNDNAAAAFVGEIISTSRVRSAATAASTATSLNVTASALALTAGDWDVSGAIGYLGTGTTSITILKAAISKTTATLPASDTLAVPTSGEVTAQFSQVAGVDGANDITIQLPTTRISLSGSTNIFLVANATFSASTLTVYGSLNARRVR